MTFSETPRPAPSHPDVPVSATTYSETVGAGGVGRAGRPISPSPRFFLIPSRPKIECLQNVPVWG